MALRRKIKDRLISAVSSKFKIIGVIAAVLIFPLLISAHTFHTSLTRMDYNEKTKTAEISIQLFSHDLVPAIEALAKKKIDLEKTPEIDRLLLQYLDSKFALENTQGEKQKINWVGKELEVDTVYLYVEIPLKESFENYNLQNSLFFESFPEQTNLVTAHLGEKKIDLIFKAGDKFKVIKNEPESWPPNLSYSTVRKCQLPD